jgi:hypothetical protein
VELLRDKPLVLNCAPECELSRHPKKSNLKRLAFDFRWWGERNAGSQFPIAGVKFWNKMDNKGKDSSLFHIDIA